MSTDTPNLSRGKTIFWLLAALVAVPLFLGMIWLTMESSMVGGNPADSAAPTGLATLADLEAKYPPIPDEVNAASALLDLWESEQGEFWAQFRRGEPPTAPRTMETNDPQIPIISVSSSQFPRNEPLDPKMLAAGEVYLEKQRAHINVVRQALSRPQSRFPLAFSNGFSMMMPHLSRVRLESKNFQLAALIATERGDAAAMIRAFADAARTAQLLAREPVFVSQFLRMAIYREEFAGLERLLSRQSLSLEQLRELDAMLGQFELGAMHREVQLAERVAVVQLLNSNNALEVLGSTESTAGRWEEKVLAFTGVLRSDRQLVLNTIDRAITLLERNDPHVLAEYEKLFRDAEAKANRFPPKAFSKVMVQGLGKVAAQFAAFEAARRAASTALAVESYRVANHGRLVEKLEELTPAFLPSLPVDPFDGRPMRFKRTSVGYRVYSIGTNRKDDGGTGPTGKGPATSAGLDEVFSVMR